nr:hypothetical protein [Tanacetum cinerariifolium]
MSVKYPNYVNLTSSSEEQPNKRTPSPPPRKKYFSAPQAPSKSISSKSIHYTSSSSPTPQGMKSKCTETVSTTCSETVSTTCSHTFNTTLALHHTHLTFRIRRMWGRGVKEKSVNASFIGAVKDGAIPSVTGAAGIIQVEITRQSYLGLSDMDVEKEKLNSVEDTTVHGSFPPLPTHVTNSADNAHGKSSYAKVTGKPKGKKLNIRTLFTSGVAYHVIANYVMNTWGKYRLVRSMFSSSTSLFSFQFSSMEGLDAMLENGLWFIRNNSLILKIWHPNENLLKENVSTVPVWVKLHGVPVTAFNDDDLSAITTKLGTPLMLDSYTSICACNLGYNSANHHYICNVRVEYEWKPPRCASCKALGHIHEECPKNTCVAEKKTLKKPSQTSQGFSVGPKMGFKPQQEYRPVSKKPAASCSGNKKKGVVPTIEVSNSNPFVVLNSVSNDEEKFEELLSSGQAILVDEAGNPLNKVEFAGDYKSKNEVASVENYMACSLASEKVGFGTQNLLEQWRDSYGNGDYDDDPYDDDLCEGQDLHQEIQAICDSMDIPVRGRKKK